MKGLRPARPRHDGWTGERRMRFMAELARTGCVSDACRSVGLSTTSAYRAYQRDSKFQLAWDEALRSNRPILEQAAFDRAVNGVGVTVRRGRKLVRYHRHSDALLRYLLERDDRRRADKGGRLQQWVKPADPEETKAEILRKVAAVKAARKRAEQEEAVAFAERMRAAGWAP